MTAKADQYAFCVALREALSLGHNYIGTEHILLGLVRENEGVAARILLDFDADAEKIRNEIIRMLSGPGRRQQGAGGAPGEKSKSSKLLDQFGRNLTKLAAEAKRPPPNGTAVAVSARRSYTEDRVPSSAMSTSGVYRSNTPTNVTATTSARP